MINLIEKKVNQISFEFNKSIQELSILVSFSGGIDSTVLASLMIELKNKYDFTLILIHFNHNSHMQAKHMENFCRSFSQNNNIEYYCQQLSISNTCNFEASARKERYIALYNKAYQLKCDIIFTAHHQDDQIETLYMKKIDGADWISKIGIRESFGMIKRPLLGISRIIIQKTAEERELTWIKDPTNNDLSLRRNYVRKILLPKAVNQYPELAKDLISESQNNKSRMDAIICKFNKNKDFIFRKRSEHYLSIYLPEIIQLEIEELKIFFYWCSKNNFKNNIPKKTRMFWSEFKKYLIYSSTGSKFILGDLICFIKRNERILIITYSYIAKCPRKKILLNNTKWYSSSFKVKNTNRFCKSNNKNNFIISNDKFMSGLYLRRWKNGDKIFSATSKKNILLSDLFINNKLSGFDKLIQPIILDKENNIVWIPGLAHGGIDGIIKNNKMKVLEWKPV